MMQATIGKGSIGKGPLGKESRKDDQEIPEATGDELEEMDEFYNSFVKARQFARYGTGPSDVLQHLAFLMK